MKRILIIITFLSVAIGCASKGKFLVEDYRSEPFAPLTMKFINISIQDERESITDRKLKVPGFSWPGQNDQTTPPLTAEHEQLIRNEISQYISNNGREFEVILFLKEGTKRFQATWLAEKEHVRVKLMINLYDGLHTPYYISVDGEAWFEVSSMDASQEFIEQLYKKALKASIYKCFEKISEFEAERRQNTEKL